MTLFTRARHKEGTAGHPRARKAVAIVAALATLSGGAAAWADGKGPLPGSGGQYGANVAWVYQDQGSSSDPYEGSLGNADDAHNPVDASNPTVRALEDRLQITVANDGNGFNGYQKLHDAQKLAYDDCVNNFNTAHPDMAGQAQCRIVGVGVVYIPAGQGPWPTDHYNGSGNYSASGWKNAWNHWVAPGNYKHGNKPYKTSDSFVGDSSHRSVDALLDSALAVNGDKTEVIVLVLDQDQPTPLSYDVTARTVSSQQGVVKAGGTQAVHDLVESHCASASCAADQTLTATSTLHWKAFDGQTYTLNGQAGRSAAESQKSRNDVPVPAAGTPGGQAVLPDFTPADLGMPMWLPGHYWFDFDYAKQGHLANPVHVGGENDAAESWKALLDLTISTDGRANTGDMTGDGKDSDDTVTDLVTLSCGDSWCPDNQVTVPSVTVMLHDPDGNVNSIVKDVTLGGDGLHDNTVTM